MSQCTAPTTGHRGDTAAARKCPVHGAVLRGRPGPVVATRPPEPTSRVTFERGPTGAILKEKWRRGSKLHREDGPALTSYTKDGLLFREEWHVNGRLHREDGPADIRYHKNGSVSVERWWLHGEKKRIDPSAPVDTYYNPDGSIESEEWYERAADGSVTNLRKVLAHYPSGAGRYRWSKGRELHREDGPATYVVRADGSTEGELWSLDGEFVSERKVYALRAETLGVHVDEDNSAAFDFMLSTPMPEWTPDLIKVALQLCPNKS